MVLCQFNDVAVRDVGLPERCDYVEGETTRYPCADFDDI